jgi:hypothetical protein
MRFAHVPDSGYGPLPQPSEAEQDRVSRLLREQRESIWRHLQQDLDVPESMREIAIAIWLDGKYD